MPQLSILIPVLGNVDLLENTLVSVLENRPDDCEIIVVSDRPYDDPYDLKDEVRFLIAPGRAGLVQCLNLGIYASRSPLIHPLGCGTEVCENWTTAALAHFDDPRVAAVAPLLLDGPHEPRVCNAGVDYGSGGARRLCDTGLSPADVGGQSRDILGPSALAGFYRREALMSLDKVFDAAVGDRLADVDLALRLRAAGYRSVLEPQSVVYCRQASLPAANRYILGRESERLFWRNAPLLGWVRSLAAHTMTVAPEVCRLATSPGNLARLVGRCVACFEFGHYLRHHQRLAGLSGAAANTTDLKGASHRRADQIHPQKSRPSRASDRPAVA